MGIIRKIGEVAKYSQTSARAQTDKTGQDKNISILQEEFTTERKPTEMTIIDGVADGGVGQLAEREGGTGKEKESPKPFKEKLKQQASAVDVERKSSGLQGGLASSAGLKKTIKDPVQNPLAEQDNPTTLVNTGAGTGKITTQQHLAGGIENKAAGSQVDPEKGATLVTDFGVSGGLGTDLASDKLEEQDTKKAAREEDNPIGSNTVEKPKVITEESNTPQKDSKQNKPSTPPANDNVQDQQSQTGSEKGAGVAGAAGVVGVAGAVGAAGAANAANASGNKSDEASGASGSASGNKPDDASGTSKDTPGKTPDSNKQPSQTSQSPGTPQQQSNGNRKYESKPSVSPSSMLAKDREDPGIIYEASAYKQRYFLQFLWTQRHFTISRNGILKYYRNTNGKRRQEFDLKKDFVSIKKYNAKTKTHPYRIVFTAQKEDYLAFDNPEMRDEFLHWLNAKATD